MKNILLYTIPFLSLLFVNAKIINSEHQLIFDDLNTINFSEKIDNINLKNIKKICSYDYCDYLKKDNIKHGIDEFTNKYIRTLNDSEIINTIKVKGIKITKIILEN